MKEAWLAIEDCCMSPIGRKFIIAWMSMLLICCASQGLSADPCMGETQYWCRAWNGNNPCVYDTCMLTSEATCNNGSVTQVWTKIVAQPPTWPRCAGPVSNPFDPPSCWELKMSCGTTIHYADSQCTQYCDGDDGGFWQACQASPSARKC